MDESTLVQEFLQQFPKQPTDGDNPINAVKVQDMDSNTIQFFGLSIREHIATHVLAGLAASGTMMYTVDELATRAVKQADALITELNKK